MVEQQPGTSADQASATTAETKADEGRAKSSTRKGLLIFAGTIVALIILCVAVTLQPNTAGRNSPDSAGTPMYFCGYDRCRDSGEYGELIFATGINVWSAPEPNRGSLHHRASHGDRVIVVERKRVFDGPGGLWFKLQGGGWTNDLWLTRSKCTVDNLEMMDFTACLDGEY